MGDLQGPLSHAIRKASRHARDRLLLAGRDPKTVREDVAAPYLAGEGIEIGALNFPLRVPRGAHVRYVDYLPEEALRAHHGHLLAAGQHLQWPDVVDDGERLQSFADESLDFVIANHFIEHAEDPIATLTTHLRVLRPGGIVYMAVPDKRHTFDGDRPVTPLAHVLADHAHGPEVSRWQHYLEWAQYVDRVPEPEVERHAQQLAERRFSIHFHVWTPAAYLELLLHCQATAPPFELEHFQGNGQEFLTVLRKP